MVLEASTTSDSDSFDASPDTPDPYDSPSPGTPQINIDIASFPKPFPVIGSLFGYDNSFAAKLIRARINQCHQRLGRPPTQEEAEALAFYACKNVSILSYGEPIMTSFGFARWWNTSAEDRFPFAGPLRKPDGWWDGNRIRIGGRELLRGRLAKSLVSITRGTAYVLLARYFGGLVVTSYAATVTGVGQLRDPRLKAVQKAITQDLEQSMAKKRDPTGQGPKSASELWKTHRQSIGANDDDDASPSAGSEQDFDGDMNRLGGSMNMGIMSDAQMRTQEAQQQQQKQPPTRQPPSQTQPSSDSPSSFSDEYGGTSSSDSSSPQPNSSSGSAWDRIRQRAGTSSSSSSASQQGGRRGPFPASQQENAAEGEFSFSNDEQERQLARGEAQRDFDRRLERERQGGSFDEGRRGW